MTAESDRRARLELLLSEDPGAARERAHSEVDRLTQGRAVVLHGCGQMGLKLAHVLADAAVPAIAFCDSDVRKQGTSIGGVEILSPAAAVERFGDVAAFVVSKWSPGDGFLDVERQLVDLGAQIVVPLPVFMWRYPEPMLPHYLFSLPEALLAFADEISVAYGLLGDDESREQFLGQLEWRLRLDYHALAAPLPLSMQYFEPGVISLSDHESFVDCGAFDGDTLRSFLRQSRGAFERVYAFEPDPDTFARLSGYRSGLPAEVRQRITVADVAVGDSPCVLHFDAAGSTSARLTDTGGTEVRCVRLDDAVERASYIKMDIEGAETGAILGARRLIADSVTRLAVSLYHTPTDFFRLVTLVHSLKPDATLRCRGYEVDGLDFVLYATQG